MRQKSVSLTVRVWYDSRCRRALCWNSMWRNLQRHEAIGLGGEVNWLIDGGCGERLPAIDLAHVDLAGGEQRPEQHGGSICRRQHGLRLDPSLELLMQAFDRIRRSRASPLARRQLRKGEQPIAG